MLLRAAVDGSPPRRASAVRDLNAGAAATSLSSWRRPRRRRPRIAGPRVPDALDGRLGRCAPTRRRAPSARRAQGRRARTNDETLRARAVGAFASRVRLTRTSKALFAKTQQYEAASRERLRVRGDVPHPGDVRCVRPLSASPVPGDARWNFVEPVYPTRRRVRGRRRRAATRCSLHRRSNLSAEAPRTKTTTRDGRLAGR